MRTLVLDDSTSSLSSENRPGFFVRQFAPECTQPQLIFDMLFGVIGPVLCFCFDPIVFRGGIVGDPLLGPYQLLAYGISIIQVPLLAVWLLLGRHLHSFSAPIGGVLIAGGIFSFVVGVLILPYSMLGMIVLIGILGFTPFITACVYFRNGRRALVGQAKNVAYSSRFLTAALGAVLSIGLPVFASNLILETTSRSTEQIISGDAKQAELAVNQMQWLPFIPQESRQNIISAYQKSKDPDRRELLRKAYREIVGEDIETRIMIMND